MSRLVVVVVLAILLHTSACKPDIADDPIPYLSFGTIYINLNLPEYARLKTDGGYHYYDDAGVKGLIIYRKDASNYLVYERNCSYRPNEACATVNVHVSTLFMEDPCCGSVFDLATGNPTGGPAWRPLRRYYSAASGMNLTITDESLDN
ncbi:MAG TPA: hypothetical protein VGD65_19290 [Chryseosolibacter sp.]